MAARRASEGARAIAGSQSPGEVEGGVARAPLLAQGAAIVRAAILANRDVIVTEQ